MNPATLNDARTDDRVVSTLLAPPRLHAFFPVRAFFDEYHFG